MRRLAHSRKRAVIRRRIVRGVCCVRRQRVVSVCLFFVMCECMHVYVCVCLVGADLRVTGAPRAPKFGGGSPSPSSPSVAAEARQSSPAASADVRQSPQPSADEPMVQVRVALFVTGLLFGFFVC